MRSRHLLAALGLVFLGGAAAACAGADPAPPPARPLVPTTAPTTAPQAGTGPRTFGCGNATCKVDKETCCTDSGMEESTCVATVAPGPGDKAQPLAAQLDACKAATKKFYFSEVSRCDDSGDCRAGEACCAQLLGHGYAVQCQGLASSPGGVCPVGERCGPDAPCRTPGTRCDRGACRKPNAALRCGTSTCTAEQACCGESPASCRPRGSCTDGPEHRCAGPKDCNPGERCLRSPMGTICMGQLDVVNFGVVCEADADCPKQVCSVNPGKQPTCGPSPFLSWIKECGCP